MNLKLSPELIQIVYLAFNRTVTALPAENVDNNHCGDLIVRWKLVVQSKDKLIGGQLDIFATNGQLLESISYGASRKLMVNVDKLRNMAVVVSLKDGKCPC